MKAIIAVILAVSITGCASSSSQYYEAVQKAAEANSAAARAKFEALSAIASAGDGQAASAAVMALALTQTPTVNPIPQQSQALQWASILATPVTSLGMMWMQADSAKTMARYSADVDLARISADATTQQALYGSFVSMGEVAGNIDYTPFVDGMVTLGTTGMDNLVDLGTAGFDANTAIATTGFETVDSVATTGFGATVDVATAGYDTLGSVTTTGMNNLLDMGIQGMLGIHETTEDWLTHSDNRDQVLLELMQNNTCTITTDANGQIVVTCN